MRDTTSKGWGSEMWSYLFKLVSLGKGALVVGVAASAAMVSNAELSNAPSHHELPTAIVSAAATKTSAEPKPVDPAMPEASDLITDCLAKYVALRAAGDTTAPGDREIAISVCKAALDQSGLSSTDFAATYGFDRLPTTEHPDVVGLSVAIRRCLGDWRTYAEQSSAACAQALAASGLSPEDFWKTFEDWAVQDQGQSEDSTTDVTALVRDCFAKYTAKDPTTLEACKKAMAESGLSGDDFWNAYGRPTPPSTSPTSSPSEARDQLILTCIKLRNALASMAETERVAAPTQACDKAFAATGLSPIEFWTKFGKELTDNPYGPKPAMAELEGLIYRCRKLEGAVVPEGPTDHVSVASTICEKAIAASGLGVTDFWARWPATKPATSPRATPTPSHAPKRAGVLELVARCIEPHRGRTSTGDTKGVTDVCTFAIRASGMSSSAFWAKYKPRGN